jgi:predicted AAA+ superfamily ATPase
VNNPNDTVERTGYLNKLLEGKDDTRTVKIVTGVRRCGKSTLMMQYIGRLVDSGVDEHNIFYLNLESEKAEDISDSKDLNAAIRAEVSHSERTYVFLDEVQRVKNWEKTINVLLVDYNADIYVTGSNAYLLSSEISTYLSGRTVEIRMLPLSFGEFLKLNPIGDSHDRYDRFGQYIRTGSMPVISTERTEGYNYDILTGIYNTVIAKDVETRLGTHDPAIMRKIVSFIMDNIGNTTSSNSISKEAGVSVPTVQKYLRILEEAYLIYKVYRYDIRGKKHLKSLEKYYACDTGIRNAILGPAKSTDESRQLENIVYLELIRRGYQVSIGSFRDAEIDFTATKAGKLEYFQVTMTMLPDSVFERETRALMKANDNFPKTVLSLDRVLRKSGQGIIHRNVIEWLLDESWMK